VSTSTCQPCPARPAPFRLQTVGLKTEGARSSTILANGRAPAGYRRRRPPVLHVRCSRFHIPGNAALLDRDALDFM
jgi:hypothetical protein